MKILYNVHSYSSFQKDQIEAMKNYYEECNVLVRTNPISELSEYLHIPFLEPYIFNNKVDTTFLPNSISIIPVPLFYLPIDNQYKKLGPKHYTKVDATIKKRKIKFDIVHSHFTWTAGYVGARIKDEYNVPFIVTAHGYDIYDLPFRDAKWKKNIEYVLNSADAVITVSNSNKKCIDKLDVQTPVFVIPNGYNNDLFLPKDTYETRSMLGLPCDKKILLSVGNLVDIKGHIYLIEAVKQVVNAGHDILCIIVGGGKLEPFLRNKIRKFGLDDNVLLVGRKPHDEMPLWMNACDIFVLPSLNESFGVVNIEAMACGKPVVASNVGGIPEIIVNEDLGILFEPGDVGSLNNAIERALEKKWDKEKIKHHSEKYSWDEIAKKIMKIYISLLYI